MTSTIIEGFTKNTYDIGYYPMSRSEKRGKNTTWKNALCVNGYAAPVIIETKTVFDVYAPFN